MKRASSELSMKPGSSLMFRVICLPKVVFDRVAIPTSVSLQNTVNELVAELFSRFIGSVISFDPPKNTRLVVAWIFPMGLPREQSVRGNSKTKFVRFPWRCCKVPCEFDSRNAYGHHCFRRVSTTTQRYI